MTSQTYARGGEQARAGGVILAAISVLSAVLVIAGLAYATGTGARHKAALAAAGCEPNLSPSGLQCTTYQVLTAQYTAIINSATQQLATGAAAYTANQNHRLGPAEAALVSILATQKTLDGKLAAFPFPPSAAPAASRLLHATQALASLTARQARSTTLTRLRSYNHRADAASAIVQTDIALLRKTLDTPPTVAQEP